MIKLTFDTDREDLREIASRYWNLDEEGQFVEDVREIAEDFGFSRHQVLYHVREACTAVSTTDYCPGCGKPRVFDSRNEFRSRRVLRSHTCDDCLNKRRKFGLKSARSGVSTTIFSNLNREDTNKSQTSTGAHSANNTDSKKLRRSLEKLRNEVEALNLEIRKLSQFLETG